MQVMQVNVTEVLVELHKMHISCMEKLIESANNSDDQQYQYNMGYSEATLHLLEFMKDLIHNSP